MPLMLPAQGLLELFDDASGVEQPPRFAEALEQVRAVVAPCDKAGCFPQLYAAFASNAPDFVITL